MKFAKELDQQLVPEWRAKYFDYKAGKKKVKAVSRALNKLNASPWNAKQHHVASSSQIPKSASSDYSNAFSQKGKQNFSRRAGLTPHTFQNSAPFKDTRSSGENGARSEGTRPMTIPERQPILGRGSSESAYSPKTAANAPNYGSIVPTPPSSTPLEPPPILELPGPALDPHANHHDPEASHERHSYGKHPEHGAHSRRALFLRRFSSVSREIGGRMLSISNSSPRFQTDSAQTNQDASLEAYREFDLKQQEFISFLDKELEMIDDFYRMKEDEANDRLNILRDQLHEMRDRRLEEVIALQKSKNHNKQNENSADLGNVASNIASELTRVVIPSSPSKWMKPIGDVFDKALGRNQFGANTKALQSMGPSRVPHDISTAHQGIDSRRDFVRRHIGTESVPYRSAKRKLKLALQEFYRGLELLKSYALLNREAFRKINKKYDKATHARPTGRYLTEKVNRAWFVKSEVIEHHLHAVEDLYSRYFERGRHKIAVGKLRSKLDTQGQYHGDVYRNGLLIGAGAVFGIQALVSAANLLWDPDPIVQINTSYLLQIYAGYFLPLFLFLSFCLVCRQWTLAKINYVFVFEFDTRHHLDWKELADLPSLFLFLQGLIMWLNFNRIGGDALFIYFPVILIGLTVIVMFFPARILFHRSRSWFIYSNQRLLLAGLYPVEFRDFFLGDMFCSLTYSMAGIPLFFCLYSQHWGDPGQCNSNHSRLVGFFATLPGIWRGLQCLRRYHDTGNVFPHLVNGGKYLMTILFYMTLSLYRIDPSDSLRALFITFATVNAIYCSVWDIAMDWSLGNPFAKNRFLRPVLGFKMPWIYYAATIIDPILRFNWILYAVFSHDLQHSALLSFFVSFSEILRRAMWTLFRVENEHCTNVGRFRASRDVPLPYELSPTPSSSDTESPHHKATESSSCTSPKFPKSPIRAKHAPKPALATIAGSCSGSVPDTDHVTPKSTSQTSADSLRGTSLRLRRSHTDAAENGRATQRLEPEPGLLQRGITRVGTLMAAAHAEDFVRKKKSIGEDERRASNKGAVSSDDDDDDDDDEEDEDDVGDVEPAERLLEGDQKWKGKRSHDECGALVS
ncbi:MAG: hypothetical protein M1829_000343 [Trizodia sp. TS-e1964]|nr:MAG: hypothetical protein M1829_000343 [Trizodia sp. TS-e1964]